MSRSPELKEATNVVMRTFTKEWVNLHPYDRDELAAHVLEIMHSLQTGDQEAEKTLLTEWLK